MNKFLPLLLSLIITAGQAVYLCASADSNSEILALSQPQAAASSKESSLDTTCLPEEEHFLRGVSIYAHNFGGDEANRLAKDGVFIGSNSENNYIDLQGGNVLLRPEHNIIVSTHQAKIHVASGAAIFVAASDEGTIIYDLRQSNPNQVFAEVKKHKLVLEPSHMLVLTEQNTNDFEKLAVNCHSVAYRNAKLENISLGTIKAFVADFSIASALITIEPLQRLTVSNNKQDKLALDTLVKGAVILGDFTASPIVDPVQPVEVSKPATVKVATDLDQ